MKKIIFVVDDSETNLFTAEAALGGNYSVVTISSGKKALALLEKIKPQVILLDINMPEMDGFEVLKQIKSDTRFNMIPVIFLTAETDTDVEATGYELGVVDFIPKPFTALSLLERVSAHI
ncbi:MAG: response regulator [Defluviitaleaceae bacterium]|nr:response regulator [Defluviitaleaceae bacterium]